MIKSNSREHTNREYELELRRLREQLLLMGAKVEDIINGSIRALIDRDSELAEQMIAADRKINQLEIAIDELCMQVLARRQPVASQPSTAGSTAAGRVRRRRTAPSSRPASEARRR